MANTVVPYSPDRKIKLSDRPPQVMQVTVHIQADVIAPAFALKKANVWLSMNAGHLLLAENPELVLGESLMWRFDVIRSLPSRTRPGTARRSFLGRMQMDAVSGEIDQRNLLMPEFTRTQVLDCLEHDWGGYIDRFHALPAGEQAEWLAKQGYHRFADLLAHVMAWWNEGFAAANVLAGRQEVGKKEYDVDAFNAQAVERSAALDEAVVESVFEAQRKQWVTFLSGLPEAAFADHVLAGRLRVEIIEHYAEHAL
jgi:hypothetical protein